MSSWCAIPSNYRVFHITMEEKNVSETRLPVQDKSYSKECTEKNWFPDMYFEKECQKNIATHKLWQNQGPIVNSKGYKAKKKDLELNLSLQTNLVPSQVPCFYIFWTTYNASICLANNYIALKYIRIFRDDVKNGEGSPSFQKITSMTDNGTPATAEEVTHKQMLPTYINL